MQIEPGTVYWFTGLSGSGKTTLGRLFYLRLKENKQNIVFLDGDTLRQIFGHDLGYAIDERKKSAGRNSRLCKLLSDQGLDVVCATISLFHDCHRWNRKHIQNYIAIYIRVPLDVLVRRDQKQLYSRTLRGEVNNIMGLDLEFEEPENPDLIIENDHSTQLNEIIDNIYTTLFLEKI